MYLLVIKVKKGKLHGPSDKFNAYVTIRVRNLKTTTVPLRSNEPSWEQKYALETNDLEQGLCVEVWDKGLIWDTLLGSVWISMSSVELRTQEGPGQWWPLHHDVTKEGTEVSGVDGPTFHEIMLHLYYELPSEIPEDESQSLMERPQALSMAEGMPRVGRGEEGHNTQGTNDHRENGTEVLGDVLTEDLVRAHLRDHSDSPIAAAGYAEHGPNHGEPRLSDTDVSSVTSGHRTTTALRQVTDEASLSEACESQALADSGLSVAVTTSSGSDVHSPPTCRGPAPSGHHLERSEEDADFTGRVTMENAVALTNSISRRWDTVLQKLFSFAGVLRAKVCDTHSDPGFGDVEEDRKDTTASSLNGQRHSFSPAYSVEWAFMYCPACGKILRKRHHNR